MRDFIKRLAISTALLLVCVVSAFLGARIALNMQDTNDTVNSGLNTVASSPSPQQQEEPGTDWLILLNQTITNISKETSSSIVGISNIRDVAVGRSRASEMEVGTGSGFIFDTAGYILTNHHVIEGADRITVILSNGTELSAEVIGKDSRTDLAVLQIQANDLMAIELGDSSQLQQGELAFAIGNPLGMDLAGSITMGIISGLGRSISIDGKTLTLLQTDAAINPGNSGGPLVNIYGQVIGINTLKEFYAGNVAGIPISVEGVGFAIPIDEAMPIVNELMNQGFITRPGLGIGAAEITEEQASANDLPQGVFVSLVVVNGAADKAGMMEGDIIVGFGSNPITTFQSLLDNINTHSIGDTVEVTVWRDGQELVLSVTLEQLPE